MLVIKVKVLVVDDMRVIVRGRGELLLGALRDLLLGALKLRTKTLHVLQVANGDGGDCLGANKRKG